MVQIQWWEIQIDLEPCRGIRVNIGLRSKGVINWEQGKVETEDITESAMKDSKETLTIVH